MKSFRGRMGIAAAAFALAAGAMPEESADGALANALGGAQARPRFGNANRVMRRQRVILDPVAGDPLAGSGALSLETIRIDFEGEFTDMPAGYTADDLINFVDPQAMAPFAPSGVPTITFTGNRVTVKDLFFTAAGNLPPPGEVDFASITLDFDQTGLTDPQYDQIDVTYRFVVTASSFVRGSDGSTTTTYGPGQIDVSQTISGTLSTPEPSAAMLGVVAAGLGLAQRRRRRPAGT